MLGFFSLCGGNFWDGRAEGNETPLYAGAARHVGDEVFQNVAGILNPALETAYGKYLGPVADQALNPFSNPVEQNIEEQEVCRRVMFSRYAPLFKKVWGEPILCNSNPYGSFGFMTHEVNYRRIAVALSAYQASADVNSFSSKRDTALKYEATKENPVTFPLRKFTAKENQGHDLFYGIESDLNPERKNAGCTACHLSDRTKPDGTGQFERYTDDGYHNIGTPANPQIPGFPDPNAGLAGHTGLDNSFPHPGPPGSRDVPFGFHKTPTLRNVDKRPYGWFTKAYTHNGWFKSLKSIVHFYNSAFLGGFVPGVGTVPYEQTTAAKFGITRCDPSVEWTEEDALHFNCWPVPEVTGPGLSIGVFPPGSPVGNLGLTAEEEDAIVAYMKTFTDTYTAQPPAPYRGW